MDVLGLCPKLSLVNLLIWSGDGPLFCYQMVNCLFYYLDFVVFFFFLTLEFLYHSVTSTFQPIWLKPYIELPASFVMFLIYYMI